MSKTIALVVGLLLVAVLLLFSMTYTVNFHEVAIKTRFGKTTEDSIEREPGLKFRLPLFADKVTTFDTRLQLRETPLETVQTADGQQIVVKAFLMWNVETEGDGPLRFFKSYSSVEEANDSLADQFSTAVRAGLSRFAFNDLIGSQTRLEEAEEAIRREMLALSEKGIEPVSVGLSQLVLPPNTARAVLDRMIATRAVLSEAERNKGSAVAGINARASAQADKIRYFARNRAAEIQAQGDREAASLMSQFAEAEDLAIFLAWVDTLRTTLSQRSTVVLETAWAPFHMMDFKSPRNEHGIPQPTGTSPDYVQPEPAAPGAGTSGAGGGN